MSSKCKQNFCFSFFAVVIVFSLYTGGLYAKLDIGIEKSFVRVSRIDDSMYFNETIPFASETFELHEDKFDDSELKKLYVKLYKPDVFETTEANEAQTYEMTKLSQSRPRLRSRSAERRLIRMVNDYKAEIKCYVCDSQRDKMCYQGITTTQTCSLASRCFVELHPLYIKRGCLFADRLNRTFFCKCPLCNNKPVSDESYFNYKSLQEWRFDNHRLNIDLIEGQMSCKYCSTDGSQSTTDTQCIEGTDIPETHCGKDEICFTNIDDELALVSRGCIKRPVYNSIFFFCEDSLCNRQKYNSPDDFFQSDEEKLLKSLLPVGRGAQQVHLTVYEANNIGYAYFSNLYILIFTIILLSA